MNTATSKIKVQKPGCCGYKYDCKRYAFTLIELLVVISIIALLLSILMPSLSKVRKQAQAVVCKANLKQQGLASEFYCNENDGSMVLWQDYYTGPPGKGIARFWANHLIRYIGNKRAGKGQGNSLWYEASRGDKDIKIFFCPSQKLKPFVFNWSIRYGINPIHTSAYGITESDNIILKRDRITNPAGRLFISDSMDDVSDEVDLSRMNIPGWRHLVYRQRSNGWDIPISDRHNGGSNILFVDGHVKEMNYHDVMLDISEYNTPIWDRKNRLWNYKY